MIEIETMGFWCKECKEWVENVGGKLKKKTSDPKSK